jgi:uncharacterized protein
MPANLPPDYFEAERLFREAESTQEKIARLEDLIRTVPKHKGTDRLRADLRRKLAELKREPRSHKGGARRASAYNIGREGAGQVALIGPPNTGKSALLDALTNATPEVADYPFTTWEPLPGMMSYEDVQIQLVDTPPLNAEYTDPGLLDLIRRADLVLLVVDLQGDPVGELEESIALLANHRIHPLERQAELGPEAGIYVQFLVVANKSDDDSYEELLELFRELVEEEWPMIDVSATTGRHLDLLRRRVFESLDIIRVYSKAPNEPPDLVAPYTLPTGSTVAEMAAKVHRDFYEHLKTARVWGATVFDGQMVSRDHVLSDGDIVELHV